MFKEFVKKKRKEEQTHAVKEAKMILHVAVSTRSKVATTNKMNYNVTADARTIISTAHQRLPVMKLARE